jgi:UDP-N-acetylmuramoylalanine--D-glutamate ligase
MLANKNVLVIGLGISGRAAASLLLAKGSQVVAVDSNRKLLEDNADIESLRQKGLKTYHESELQTITQDLVVVSPGIPQTNPFYTQAKGQNIPIIGEIELACKYLKGTFLGITGSNGKTTTTTLTTHVLNASGFPARALGNVGNPLTVQCLEKTGENIINVVELSSFQLETMQSPIIDAAVLLNISPNHLDRYNGNFHEYALTKWKIANCLKNKAQFYVEEKCFQEWGYLFKNLTIHTYGYHFFCHLHTDLTHILAGKKIECVLPSHLQGKRSHDLENILAAYSLCRYIGVTPDQFISALGSFKKPSHRIEFVRELNGVEFYDDSKGTSLDAVMRAVESINRPIILIAGGVDKGAAYTPWIKAFSGKVKLICAIGQAAQKIVNDLAHALPVTMLKSFEDAVNHAAQQAKPGDVVLLSPGCSSYDMFRDYAHRGEEFQRFVRNLKE